MSENYDICDMRSSDLRKVGILQLAEGQRKSTFERYETSEGCDHNVLRWYGVGIVWGCRLH